ncbi:galacturonosyltransferase 14 [Hordeum vulgare]|nr:galacturonosyltransferase 14 [Hordeum vulgare]
MSPPPSPKGPTPARKRQGNIVVQGGIPAGLAEREGTPGAAAAPQSARPPTGKMSKVSGVKRKKVTTKRPSSTPSAPARCSPTVPFYNAASTAGEVFDERVGNGGLNNAAAEFVNLLDINTVNADQAPVTSFDYNKLEGGVDDHGGEDEVEEVDEGTYQ